MYYAEINNLLENVKKQSCIFFPARASVLRLSTLHWEILEDLEMEPQEGKIWGWEGKGRTLARVYCQGYIAKPSRQPFFPGKLISVV